MEYRRHKNFLISELGLGTYGLGGSYGPVDIDQYKKTIQRAFELGVNFFDTAAAYGDAEQILGEAVRPFRDQVLIATKIGLMDGFKPNLSLEYIQSACESSLRELGTDMIDLYQVHFDDPSTPVSETVEALEQLVDQGKIREYGLGHLPSLRIWEYTQISSVFSVMMEFNALSREAKTELLPFCIEHHLAAIAFSVTGRGLLTRSITSIGTFDPGDIRSIDPQFQRINFESGLRVAEKLNHLGKKYHKTSVQCAIAWALAQPGITCALTGPSSVAHLEENLGGAGWEIDQADLDALDQFFLEECQNRLQEQGNTVRKILNQPLPEDPEQALIDLVYASESAIKLKYIRQEDMLPIFLQLIELRGKLDGHSYKTLAEIQQDLARMIEISENE